jgi:hypothetical protein
MSLINHIKPILNSDVIIIFLIISYILIFKISKDFKGKNYHRDYKIVKITGIIYGLIAIAAIIIKNI